MTNLRLPRALATAVDQARRSIDQALDAGRREIAHSLATAMALQGDHVLQTVLRRIGGGVVSRAFLLRLGDDPAWISLGAGGGGVLHRILSRGALEARLEDLLVGEQALAARLDLARATYVDAAEALTDLAFSVEAATPAGWGRLKPWSPLLDAPAYRVALRVAAALDAYGPALRASPRPPAEALLLYWRGVDLFHYATTLACRVEGRGHLATMATRFDWTRVSPSWPMLRHRSLGLAVSAARTAAAFGPDAIPSYFRRLESGRSRLERFDALFGLLAIGLAEPSTKAAVHRDLSQIAGSSHRPAETDIDHAVATLEGGMRARNSAWLLQSHFGRNPSTPSWRRLVLCDALLELPDGAPVAFAGLSELAAHETLRSRLTPPGIDRTELLPRDVRTLVRRLGSVR